MTSSFMWGVFFVNILAVIPESHPSPLDLYVKMETKCQSFPTSKSRIVTTATSAATKITIFHLARASCGLPFHNRSKAVTLQQSASCYFFSLGSLFLHLDCRICTAHRDTFCIIHTVYTCFSGAAAFIDSTSKLIKNKRGCMLYGIISPLHIVVQNVYTATNRLVNT